MFIKFDEALVNSIHIMDLYVHARDSLEDPEEGYSVVICFLGTAYRRVEHFKKKQEAQKRFEELERLLT